MSAMSTYPICQAHNCSNISEAEKCAGLSLCNHHTSYLLFIRSLIEAQVEEGEISEKEIEYILVEEGKALCNPTPSDPEFILIIGGKCGEKDDVPRPGGAISKRRSTI